MRSRGAWIALVLFLCLNVAVRAQGSGSGSGGGAKPLVKPMPAPAPPDPGSIPPADGKPLPPPPPELSPEEREALTQRLMQLEEARLRLQERIIAQQESCMKILGDGNVEPGEVGPEIERVRTMSRQLLILSDQAFAVARRLGPPKLWPEGSAERAADLQIRFKKGMLLLKEGRRDLAKAWRAVAGEGDPVLDEDFEGGESGSDGGGSSDGVPGSEAEAGQAIRRGDVEDAKNLIEIFMHVPETRTPRARLDYYRSLRKGGAR